ncbi:macrophage mannose receptor 1-like [Saccostrea echinata]|uniref:macrophage mannose receptor 1-like n=1 Tax=Saccostrea echinata TaxID=191078 RepID=UPI002A7F24DD|nr:macrophage mannose receptor 1-like [Saccostrea echinata]
MRGWIILTGCLLSVWILQSTGDLIGQYQQCGDGWVQRKGSNSCYFWETNNLQTYAGALQECNLMNADLLVINDDAEQDWVNVESETNKVYNTGGWYMGLQKSPTKGWAWTTQTGTSNINWKNEPDDADNQDCGSVNQYGRFSDDFCNNKYGYICQYPAPQGQACPKDSGKVRHMFANGNICIYVSNPLDANDLYTWQNAKRKCQNINPSASLVSVKTYIDLASLQFVLSTQNPNVQIPWWTGLNDQQKEGAYVWQDGSTYNTSIVTWDKAPSSDASERQNCAIMRSGGSVDDVTCATRAFYVCEANSLKNYIDVGCGPWKRAEGRCYLFGNGQGYSWSDARAKCQKAGADLVKVDDKNQYAWLKVIEMPGWRGYWTGLRDAGHEGTWLWQDGSTCNASYVNWRHEPNNYASNEDCGQMFGDGVLNDLDCQAHLGYICEYPKPPGKTCLTNWVGNGNSCYFFSNASSSDKLRWKDVYQRCNDLASDAGVTANYLSIDSQGEKTFVQSQVTLQIKNSGGGWWTGLNDQQAEGVWMFNGATALPDPSLLNWANEPNNAGGNENCAAMYKGGRFNDLPCDAKAYFICQKPVPGFQSSSSIVTPSFVACFVLSLLKLLL